MKTILITGANQGFGKALFQLYSDKGWKVFPLIRDESALSGLKEINPSCFPILADLRDDDLIDKVTKVLSEQCDTLELLINNAGYVKKVEGALNITSEILEDHFKVNVSGIWNVSKAAYQFLIKAGHANIINVSSRRGSIEFNSSEPFARALPYKVSKCALNMLSVLMDEEFSKEGIRVIPVHPGKLKTWVAPPDADTTPEAAALKLYEWVTKIDANTPCKLYDLMNEDFIPW
ncbi:MAG: SDR family NAD(P)-dependent oxidoreductase [Bacteroidetes bacterium]|nr:SDR family NAD(P)-dependent oxidoreductase [Bacteroidota bacterium]